MKAKGIALGLATLAFGVTSDVLFAEPNQSERASEEGRLLNSTEERELRKTYRMRNEAYQSSDFEALYDIIVHPEWRKQIQLDDFKEAMSQANPKIYAEIVEICKCDITETGKRCQVSSDFSATKPDGQVIEQNLLELLEYLDGRWYVILTDPQPGEGCP